MSQFSKGTTFTAVVNTLDPVLVWVPQSLFPLGNRIWAYRHRQVCPGLLQLPSGWENQSGLELLLRKANG